MSDPRLELVTLTGVDVSRDLAHAKVYYSTLAATAADARGAVDDDAAHALRGRGAAPAGRGRPSAAHPPGPEADFVVDPGIVSGQRIEEILRGIHHDAERQDEAGSRRARNGEPDSRTTTDDRRRRRARPRRGRDPRRRARDASSCHVSPDGDALGSMLGAAPRAARRGHRQRRVVLRAVRRRAALPRAARPRAADAARARSTASPR